MGRRSLEEHPSFEFPDGFEPDPTAKRIPIPGEKGYLEPEFHRDEQGRIVDDAGSVYDEYYRLREKAAPPELEAEIARLKITRKELANNRGALLELAKISLSAKKSGMTYETTPYPPLDN